MINVFLRELPVPTVHGLQPPERFRQPEIQRPPEVDHYTLPPPPPQPDVPMIMLPEPTPSKSNLSERPVCRLPARDSDPRWAEYTSASGQRQCIGLLAPLEKFPAKKLPPPY